MEAMAVSPSDAKEAMTGSLHKEKYLFVSIKIDRERQNY